MEGLLAVHIDNLHPDIVHSDLVELAGPMHLEAVHIYRYPDALNAVLFTEDQTAAEHFAEKYNLVPLDGWPMYIWLECYTGSPWSQDIQVRITDMCLVEDGDMDMEGDETEDMGPAPVFPIDPSDAKACTHAFRYVVSHPFDYDLDTIRIAASMLGQGSEDEGRLWPTEWSTDDIKVFLDAELEEYMGQEQ